MKRKKLLIISIASLIILISATTFGIFKTSFENTRPPIVVIRIDDIQDFAFREAQLFLLNESMINQIPVSLAVITGMFGEDTYIVQKVKLAVKLGSEVTVHGWKHEDFASLSLSEQIALLSQAKNKVIEIIDYDTSVLVPPMFSFNENTITAMNQQGYKTISTLSDYMEPGLYSRVISLPATVELADFSYSSWYMKNVDSVIAEVSNSIKKYGFAVIVTHPQEFIVNGLLSQANTNQFSTLLKILRDNYTVTTLEKLSETLILNGKE